MNEHFAQNMTGQRIKFEVQPHYRGIGTISKITPREVTVREFSIERGSCRVTFECFDVDVAVEQGSETGALWGGMPVAGTTHDLAGKTTRLIGVSYGDIYRAVEHGKTIIIARCG